MRRGLAPFALALVCALPGCMNGWLYKNYKQPIVLNMRDTPRGSRMVEIDSYHLEVPYTQGMVNTELFSRAIGDAAKRHGLEKVYFADLHTVSVFGNLYKRQSVEVWGD
jgi:hypothetical protein